MEAARSWLAVTSPTLPSQVAVLLASHSAFGPVVEWSAEPEVRLQFDALDGEPRNTDLLVKARDAHGDFLIAVESKADESFGETVTRTLAAAQLRLQGNARSGGVKRISGLLSALFGSTLESEPALGGLQYQLLTATAGAATAALRSGGQRVVILVQEFRTTETTDKKHELNASALDAFVERLSLGAVTHVESGQLVGPFTLQGAVLYKSCPPIFFGKVRHELRG